MGKEGGGVEEKSERKGERKKNYFCRSIHINLFHPSIKDVRNLKEKFNAEHEHELQENSE